MTREAIWSPTFNIVRVALNAPGELSATTSVRIVPRCAELRCTGRSGTQPTQGHPSHVAHGGTCGTRPLQTKPQWHAVVFTAYMSVAPHATSVTAVEQATRGRSAIGRHRFYSSLLRGVELVAKVTPSRTAGGHQLKLGCPAHGAVPSTYITTALGAPVLHLLACWHHTLL